jgi:hypothetical protein
MKREEFDKLKIAERVNNVGNDGDYIALREYKNYLIGLYILDGFFVEVEYKNGRKIENVVSLNEEQVISLYMNDMDFSVLFE